jgi:hypothetical protein
MPAELVTPYRIFFRRGGGKADTALKQQIGYKQT